MTFQIQLLTAAKAKRFTAPVLKEARKVFKEIRMAMLDPDPEQDPFRVPQFDKVEELIFFLGMVGDDEWIKANVDIFEFVEAGNRIIGFGLRKDRKMWLSEEGRIHLGTNEIRAFTPLTYVKKQLAAYL